jgi:hypothetical protein
MNTTTMQLGHSELIYLLWLIKTLSLPGIGSKPLYNQSNDQLIASVVNAKQSLQARGLIGIGETDVRINRHARTLVSTCALARATLMLESQNKDSPAKYLSFHFRSAAWVRHAILDTGVHNFSLVKSPLPDFCSLIGESPLQDRREPPAIFTLPKLVVDLVFTLFSYKQPREGDNVFQGTGLPGDLGRILIDTLSDLQQKIMIGITFHNQIQDKEGEPVLLIRNTQGFWRVGNLIDNGSVKLTSVSQSEVIELFNHIVRQAQGS